MKTYIIRLGKAFPKSHRRAGEPTNFAESLLKTKIHTIRTDYAIWRKRFEKIYKGEACLSIQQWEGRPFHSNRIELARLTREDGIGLEKLYITKDESGLMRFRTRSKEIPGGVLAKNEGMLFEDWISWVDNPEMLSTTKQSKPLPIIHLTSFRYGQNQ